MALVYEQNAPLFYLSGSVLLLTGLLFGVVRSWMKLTGLLSALWIIGLLIAAAAEFALPFTRGILPLNYCLFWFVQASIALLLVSGVFLLHAEKISLVTLFVGLGGALVMGLLLPAFLSSDRLTQIWHCSLFIFQIAIFAAWMLFDFFHRRLREHLPVYPAVLFYSGFCLYSGVGLITGGGMEHFALLQFVAFFFLCVSLLWELFSITGAGAAALYTPAMVEGASRGMALVDGRGRVAAMNRRMMELLGGGAENPGGQVPPLERSGLQRLGPLGEECRGREIVLPGAAEGAESRTLSVTVKKVSLGHRGAQGLYVEAEDITERKKVLDEYRVAQDYMETLFQSVGACEFSRNGRRLSSERLFHMLGYSVEAMDMLQVRELTHPQDRGLYDWARPFRSPEEEYTFSSQLRLRNAEGSYIWFHISSCCKPVEDRRVVKGIAINIDAMKRMEASLAQGEKFAALGQLTGGIVHDMNNHLMTIQTSLGLLNKVSDEKLRHKYSTYMQEALNNAVGMLKRLLSFSKGDEEYRLVEMNAMISVSVDLLERAVSHRVRLQTDLRSEQQLVWGNYYDLQNIVLNIGLNARDALPISGGVISVSTWTCDANPLKPEATAPWYCISIRDNGCGIPPELQQCIFDPFFTTKPQGKGSGLGLFITYGAVQRHGGTIRVESAPGAGTEFLLSFPLAKENFAQAEGGTIATNQ